MPTIEATKDNFEELILNNDTVLVDFWAEWCGPCRMFGPVYEKMSEQHPDLVFAKVDTEVQAELAGYFQIRSIPTLMIFRQKVVLFSQPGALPEPVLADVIARVKAVDMEAVHAEITSRKEEAAAG